MPARSDSSATVAGPWSRRATYSLSRRPSQTLASSADSIMLLRSRSASASRRPASSASAVPMVVVMAPPFPVIPGGGYLPHAADRPPPRRPDGLAATPSGAAGAVRHPRRRRLLQLRQPRPPAAGVGRGGLAG